MCLYVWLLDAYYFVPSRSFKCNFLFRKIEIHFLDTCREPNERSTGFQSWRSPNPCTHKLTDKYLMGAMRSLRTCDLGMMLPRVLHLHSLPQWNYIWY